MKILGLGITHDSGAAVVDNGALAAALNEERLNRIKNYVGFPELSVREVLRIIGIPSSEIDLIAVNPIAFAEVTSDYEKTTPIKRFAEVLSAVGVTRLLAGTDGLADLTQSALNLLRSPTRKNVEKRLRRMGFQCPIRWVDHHRMHAAGAYYCSGWRDCLTLTLDGAGDGYCSRVYDCRDNEMREINKVLAYHSPSPYYSYVTYLLGFKMNRHEGKITGLAAYGDPSQTLDVFRKRVRYLDEGFSFRCDGLYRNAEINVLRRAVANFSREDVAAGIQAFFEEIIPPYVAHAVRATGHGKIALAGGVFANVKLNQRLRELPGVEDIFVFPHMGDGGGGVGSAYALCQWGGGPKVSPAPLKNVYLGPEYSEEEILAALQAEQDKLAWERPDDPHAAIASLLASDKIVARFNGRMELGPRALGNRSILYPAKDPEVNDWLNQRLRRTEFMPFAPAILEEHAGDYLLGYDPEHHTASYFMTDTYAVTDRAKREVPAVVHVDGTARPQLVSKERNPDFAAILEAYHDLTGVPVLVNTSFNMHEEPIVCTPEDAVRAFLDAGLDCLAMGPFLVRIAK